MNETQKKIKENKYISGKIDEIIKTYNMGKRRAALEELEKIIMEVNQKTIKEKLKKEVKQCSINDIRKIYKENDEELYQEIINMYSMYEEIYESEEIEQKDFIYLLNCLISMLEKIIEKYGEIK